MKNCQCSNVGKTSSVILYLTDYRSQFIFYSLPVSYLACTEKSVSSSQRAIVPYVKTYFARIKPNYTVLEKKDNAITIGSSSRYMPIIHLANEWNILSFPEFTSHSWKNISRKEIVDTRQTEFQGLAFNCVHSRRMRHTMVRLNQFLTLNLFARQNHVLVVSSFAKLSRLPLNRLIFSKRNVRAFDDSSNYPTLKFFKIFLGDLRGTITFLIILRWSWRWVTRNNTLRILV